MSKQIVDLARKYKAFSVEAAEVKAELDVVNKAWGECETELLEAMVEAGVNSVKLDGVGNFSMATKNFLSVTAAHKEEFFVYLKESGNAGLLKLDVNPATLKAFLSGHLEQLIRDRVNKGMNEVDARKEALELLNKRGASYHTERGIRMLKA